MAIKVNIPSGQNIATVSGLYQWDYGQVLEIESTDLGNMIGEVHFACSSMSEAVVVSCNFTEGLGLVRIPDECLEQSSNITAWVYEISGTQGRTRKVITIYVTARTRPSVAQDIPTEISNRYTELITEVNEAVDKLENGDVVAKKATEADRASTAASAGNASTANYAVGAGDAKYAQYVRNGNNDIDLKLCLYINGPFKVAPTQNNNMSPMLGGIIIFNIETLDECSFVMELPQNVAGFSSPLFPVRLEDKTTGYVVNMNARLAFSRTEGGYVVELQTLKDGFWISPESETDVYIRYKYIGEQYPYIS